MISVQQGSNGYKIKRLTRQDEEFRLEVGIADGYVNVRSVGVIKMGYVVFWGAVGLKEGYVEFRGAVGIKDGRVELKLAVGLIEAVDELRLKTLKVREMTALEPVNVGIVKLL